MASIFERLFSVFRRGRRQVEEPASAQRPGEPGRQPQRLRSALFVDFDNIFHGVHSRRPDVADALARNFSDWLGDLATTKLPPGATEREILVWRAYINPKGGVKDEDGTGEWLSISRFRQALLLSGFEVVDCPALTAGMKNAADIRMVVDVLSTFYSDSSGPPYDEFVIASDDADFTPLLQHLRAHGCRTMIVSAGNAAHAYANIADESFDLINYLTTSGQDVAPAAAPARRRVEAPRPPGLAPAADALDEARVVEAARGYVQASRIAIPLTSLAGRIGTEFGTPESWFGHDSLGAFLQTTELASAYRISGGYIWDPAAHAEPRPLAAPPAPMPETLATLLRDTILPQVGAREYWAVFAALESYVRSRGQRPTSHYEEDDCVSWCHSHLLRQGMQARESDIRQILARTRVHLEWTKWTKLPPAPEDVCNKVLNNTRRTIDGRPLRPTELDDLRQWLWQGRPTVRRPEAPRAEPLPSTPRADNPIKAVRPDDATDETVVQGTLREVIHRMSTFNAFRVRDRSDFGRALAKAMLGPLGYGSWGKVTVHHSIDGRLLSYTFWIESQILSAPQYQAGATVSAELRAQDIAGHGLEWICTKCEVVAGTA